MTSRNFENRTLFHCDNLPVLQGMNSETIDLIATDPPFNKNKDFHATPDSLAKGARFADRWDWDKDVHPEWVDQIQDDWPGVHDVIAAAKSASGMDMAAFLCWIGVRLMEMRRVLKPDGSIYLHIDHTAHAWTKALMDAIFGRASFRNEIVWKRVNVPKVAKNRLGAVHDTILFYAKSKYATFNPIYMDYSQEYINTHYKNADKFGKFQITPLTAAGIRYGTSGEPWRGINVSAKGLHWAVPSAVPAHIDLPSNWMEEGVPSKLEFLEKHGLIYWPPKGSVPRFKRYLSTQQGVRVSDVIMDISSIQGASKERTGYPTQKPLSLYERIIETSSNPGDIVLDPFAGCATTPVAAERLGREWVGIDIWDSAYKTVLDRLESEGLAVPETDHAAQSHLLTFGQIHYRNAPPIRTDDDTIPVPDLKLKLRRAKERWQKLSHKEMLEILADAQSSADGVICAGCGRVLEVEFMELDHVQPKSSPRGTNYIDNRVLICRPCNGKKSNRMTLNGLWRENEKDGWIRNADLASIAESKAYDRALQVKDEMYGYR